MKLRTKACSMLCVLAMPVAGLAESPSQTKVPLLARQLNDAFASVYEKMAPSVVVIVAKRAGTLPVSGLPQGLNLFLRLPDEDPSISNQGSGIIYSPDGYIITNKHVIDADGRSVITVVMNDGKKYPATLVGTDSNTDVAVIKIAAKNLPVAELADSNAVKVGQFAFAIGSPYELPGTFTAGIISARGRTNLKGGFYEEFLQTDASINPGNSGGPLCDIDGRVVGINTLVSGLNRGLGFAIPINVAKDIASQLIKNGRVIRPWLGIIISGIEEDERLLPRFAAAQSGVVVREIGMNTPADGSDLRMFDVIQKIDGVPVALASELQRQILQKKVGQPVLLAVWRDGKMMEVSLKTGEQPGPNNMPTAQAPQKIQGTQPPSSMSPIEAGPLGMKIRDLPPELSARAALQPQKQMGVVVEVVSPGSPAAVAGIEPGDVITEAGGRPVLNRKDYDAIMGSVDISQGIMLILERGGEKSLAIIKP